AELRPAAATAVADCQGLGHGIRIAWWIMQNVGLAVDRHLLRAAFQMSHAPAIRKAPRCSPHPQFIGTLRAQVRPPRRSVFPLSMNCTRATSAFEELLFGD